INIGYEVSGWTISYEATNRKSLVKIFLKSPPTAIIGHYSAFIYINGKMRQSTKFLLLFNPWNKSDIVYMDDERKRWEYVNNTHTIIYMGSHTHVRPRGWYLGQFQSYSIEAALIILDRMPAEDRSSPIRVCRFFSAMVNANDDNGVLSGNWSGNYANGTSPNAWNGSSNILAKYVKYRAPVRYGQCWVFCGVLCTVLRTCGIPTRCITTYNSFHDHDGSLSWELYFNRFMRPVYFKRQETMWYFKFINLRNYHCWNESWMDRKDLPPGYGGWQIVDSTPQERSQGSFKCGPAPQIAVKEGDVDLLFDTGFVFAEVNADKIFYYQKPRGGFRVGRIDSQIAVGSNIREDITSSYKYPDNSQAERFIQNKIQNKKRRIREIRKSFVKIEISAPYCASWKNDCNINFKLINTSNILAKVKFRLLITCVSYRGRVNATLSEQMCKYLENSFNELIKAYQLRNTITNDMSSIKVDINGLVNEEDFLHAETTFEIDKPKIRLFGIPQNIYAGKNYRINIAVTNPLDKPLTNAKLFISGDVVKNGKEKILIGTINSLGSFEGYFEFRGEYYIYTSLQSNELSGFDQHISLRFN
ncbi:hypothetical protein MXB_4081, partial [Myxobolus squamalis]